MKTPILISFLFVIVFASCKKDDIQFVPITTRTVQIAGYSFYYICFYDNEQIKLDATTPGAISYIWNTGETTPTIFATTGGYSVTVTTNDTTFFYSTSVDYRGTTFYVPNTFSPDGDENNDFFGPQGVFGISKFQMKIYNPELKCVYSTRDYTKPWNGKFHNKGNRCPFGFYYYYFEYSTLTGEAKTKSGMVELLN